MLKKTLRLAGFVALGLGLLLVWACIQRPMQQPLPDPVIVETQYPPQSNQRDVDILFVIDNSISMGDEQTNVMNQFVTLMETLKQLKGGLPNVHVGVVSTDVGTGNYTTIPNCTEVGGDRGVLGKEGVRNLGEECVGPNQRYIVDVEPEGCDIEKDQDGDGETFCTSDTCAQAQCDAMGQVDEVLTLTIDDRGCPRCINYSVHPTLEDTFYCLANLGVDGCGFEQQFEAMFLALDVNQTPENRGFLRGDALLSVVMITDEDDCSASQPGVIFNPDPAINNLTSSLGFLHSFRCFEFGMACDVGGRELGTRNECTPRGEEDPASLLFPITRYTGQLEALRDPSRLVVAVIGGPYDGGSVGVVPDPETPERPSVQFSCVNSVNNEGAKPGVRLRAFAAHFNDGPAMGQWAYTSVCTSDFNSALQGIGNKIVEGLSEACFNGPIMGCSAGPAGTECQACIPKCVVYDLENKGLDEQKKVSIPWCGSLCQNGLCTEAEIQECEFDGQGRCGCTAGLYPTELYGQPGCAPLYFLGDEPSHDGNEPQLATLVPRQEPSCVGLDCPEGSEGQTSACWYLTSETGCGFDAGFKIVRADKAPPRTIAEVRCKILPSTELSCHNGKDDDQDCLVDQEDPDCQP